MKLKRLMVLALSTALTFGSVMTASAAWVQEGTNWKYQNVDGSWQAGKWFKDVDSRSYHFDANGMVQKGWFLDTDGKWYFMDYAGVMQVGLIKVDNAVYYMNDNGELFIGDKAINGTTYTFGLYGTTKGTPGVTQDRTYGGNGNQTLSSGGGSNSGSGQQTPSEKVYSAVNDVKSAVSDSTDSLTTIAPVKVGDPVTTGTNTAEVAVPVKVNAGLDFTDSDTIDTARLDINEVVSSVLDTVEDEDAVIVDIPGIKNKEFKAKDLSEKLDTLLATFVTEDNLENKNKASITVPVNGVKLTYVISINK